MEYRGRAGWRDLPFVTIIIMAACVIVWLAETALCVARPSEGAAFLSLGEFSPSHLQDRPWTAFTSLFLHEPVSIWHILFNMIALWSVAPVLESLLGHGRFTLLYLLSGLGGDLGMLIWGVYVPAGWDSASYGASGAIFGLFAAVLIACVKAHISILSMVWGMLPNLFMPLVMPNIAWQAHLGGFIVGGVLSLILFSGMHWRDSYSL